MVELAVRLVFSLAVVVGLLLLTVKVGGRKFRPRNGAAVRIVHRQALSRGTAVAVVEVGNRVLVLGTTEHQVNVLAELDEGELDGPADLTLVDSTLDPASHIIALEEVRSPAPVHLEASPEATVPARRPGSHAARPAPKRKAAPAAASGPLAGSILSPQTWRQALGAASGRAS
jgi:flagellar protein FliO/FliZ